MSLVFIDYSPPILLVEDSFNDAEIGVPCFIPVVMSAPASDPAIMFSSSATQNEEAVTIVESLVLELQYQPQNNNFYVKNLYDVNKRITSSNIYTDSGMGTLLFSRIPTYTLNGNLLTLTITRVSTGQILTKTFTYDVDFDMTDCTRTVT